MTPGGFGLVGNGGLGCRELSIKWCYIYIYVYICGYNAKNVMYIYIYINIYIYIFNNMVLLLVYE